MCHSFESVCVFLVGRRQRCLSPPVFWFSLVSSNFGTSLVVFIAKENVVTFRSYDAVVEVKLDRVRAKAFWASHAVEVSKNCTRRAKNDEGYVHFDVRRR